MRKCFECVVILFLFLSIGCVKKANLPSSYLDLKTDSKLGDIIHTQTGFVVSEKDMMNVIKDSRIIYIGETHDNVEAHQVQLAVIKKLYELYPGKISVGMEMFPKSYQKILDKWTQGGLTEKEFVKQTKWYSTWGLDFRYYVDIFNFIKEKNIQLVGLNVSSELMKDIRINGFERAVKEYGEAVPDMDIKDPYYISYLEAYFSGHGTTGRGLDTFIKIQTLRDEIMAKTITDFLAEKNDMKMVVLAGGSHVNYGFGIPRRVFRKMPVLYKIVIPEEIFIPEDKKDKLMDVDLPGLPMPVADFIWMVGYTDLDKDKIRLGIMTDESSGQLVVKDIIPNSLAQKSGIMAGDIVNKYNGEVLTEVYDLIYLLDKEKSGNKAVIEILRNGKEIKLDIILTSLSPISHK